MSKKITRRQFIIGAATGVGATIACGGLTALVFRRPHDSYFRKLAANQNPMNPIVLVTYGTRAGSTMEIARTIVLELEKRSFTVDICPISQVTDLDQYSHVVIGSAIRMGAPLPEVTEFVLQNRDTFTSMRTACFAVYLMNSGNDDESSKARLAYLDPIRNHINMRYEAFFTGVFNPAKVSIIEGFMGKMLQSPVGDFRDWAAIINWSQSIFTV